MRLAFFPLITDHELRITVIDLAAIVLYNLLTTAISMTNGTKVSISCRITIFRLRDYANYGNIKRALQKKK